ncbi:alpha/beta fold hydrolase [Bdellovibrio sp. SKB1291214]|uniref:alpha/beta hydrolase n=1 Tax=Bdellovibrio sp. SKB1291214 TaxID=1732569 RepID=UPI000B5150FE|nr:alpha/beta fold hydrolase [Bdellovibrio sp. SKB1291214]UYL09274.1 alpha/beta fold hydrolase [Bdellovibrio sp. SKB1291214]
MKLAFDLRDFKIPVDRLAPQEVFRTRQKDVLSYRFYSTQSENLVILYHGVGGDSRYLCALASAIAKAGIAQVVTPDFRGHGASLAASDLIAANQLEIDLEELIIHIKMKTSVKKMILSGHSLGGGFALRIAASDIAKQFSKFVAIAPYLPKSFNALTDDLGGWIFMDRDGEGISVNYPEIFKSGEEKTHYSSEFIKAAVVPEDLLFRLREENVPVAVVTGDRDEVVLGHRHQEIFEGIASPVVLEAGLNHLTIVSKPAVLLSLYET